VALFSATVPPHVLNITTTLLKDPVNITVEPEKLVLDGIAQYYVAVEDDKQKFAVLQDLFERLTISQTIIYCNSVERVNELHNAMKSDGYPVCCIHSSMDKQERTQSYEQFKAGRFRVLISSNVTARGIDIQQVSVVINFDIPKDVHTYLHRIGRSGRWGRKGVGINLITRRDMSKLKETEQYYSTQIKEMPASFDTLAK
jgi:translation initiation factor 4A